MWNIFHLKFINNNNIIKNIQFKWSNINLEQLNLNDIMMQRIFNIECEQIILKYEKYKNLLHSRLNETKLNSENSRNISYL